MSEEIRREDVNVLTSEQKPREPDAGVASSSVLARLIEEVRNEKAESPNAYNRMHNRHNRSR
jgi:hypothetical protein